MQPKTEHVREFVIAGHGNLPRVRELLAEFPALLNAPHEWGPNDFETAIQAAAHVGNAPIAEFLLEQGAPLEICTAAMLGRRADVEALLAEEPALIETTGAHRIPLLTHAALSEDTELVAWLYMRGATSGASSALSMAVYAGNQALAQWLLENADPDLAAQDFRGKTVLEAAIERNDSKMVSLLRAHGAE